MDSSLQEIEQGGRGERGDPVSVWIRRVEENPFLFSAQISPAATTELAYSNETKDDGNSQNW